MVHKLLFEVDYNLGEEQYSDLLLKWEFARGSTVEVVFYVTNISNYPFTGTVNEISTLFNTTAFGSSSIITQNIRLDINQLPPHQKTLLHKAPIRMYSEGKGWFRIKAEARDNGQIEYFQAVEFPPVSIQEWLFGFDVINREQLEIINLLRKINEKSQ